VNVLSRDPGQKPGYVWLDGAGTVLRASHRREEWVDSTMWDIACTERQWWFPKCDADPNDLFQLAFDAGWSLASIPALRYMRILPKDWRESTTANKAQVQKRIARDLTTDERRAFLSIPAGRHGDVLDSIGIGRAAIRLAHLTTYDWPSKGYGN
jgi:hypothetical protein